MASAEWSKNEKTIARQAFDLAFERESAGFVDEVRRRADRIASLDDVREIQDFLRIKRKEFDEKYDFRYLISAPNRPSRRLFHPDAAINESEERARRHGRIPCADVPITQTTKL